MKLFVFEFDNNCDYSHTVIVQAETEQAARDLYDRRAYARYAEGQWPLPAMPFEEYRVKWTGHTLAAYALLAAFDVAPNDNPRII